MIVFCDTSVHIALLRGDVSVTQFNEMATGTVRLSPVVASDLLRCARGRGVAAVESLIAELVNIQPHNWASAWRETGSLLPLVFPHHEQIGLARLQNDCLIALTARDTGALLVTADKHFVALQKHITFPLKLVRW
jgi:predicted nucleic acid-binding protein